MQQQMILPEGGLASFLTSNADEFDDSRLAFGRQSGINSFRDTAERMAQMGRGGDTELIHASKNELVVSPEILEQNPGLSQELGRAFDNSGVDISQYVVGAEENNVNPYTGQREFRFSLSRTVGKIKKAVKKFAPIIIAAGINIIAPGLGSIAAGALSGGITSLVQGGNFKDSMKSALMGGFVGGVSAGVKGLASSGKEGMFKKFTSGVQKFGMPTGGNIFDTGTRLFEPEGGDRLVDFSTQSAPQSAPGGTISDAPLAQPVTGPIPAAVEVPANSGAAIDIIPNYEPTGYVDNLMKNNVGGRSNFAKFFTKPSLTAGQAEAQLTAGGSSLTGEALGQAGVRMAEASGGIRYIPTAGAALAGSAALGAFDPIPEEPVEDPYGGKTTEDYINENPEMFANDTPQVPYQRASMADIMVPSDYQNYYEQYLNQPQYAAAGGEMQDFPRRTGYIGGPGTETSDSIPAMLSDGEFVMNAKAVRGAGGGSRQKGVRKMYDMMRAFEGGAVA